MTDETDPELIAAIATLTGARTRLEARNGLNIKRDAAGSNNDDADTWFAVAQALRVYLAQPVRDGDQQWIYAAAELTASTPKDGYGAQQLRTMLRALDYLESVAATDETIRIDDYRDAPVSKLDAIVKISQLNATEARKLLPRLISTETDPPSYRELLKEYQNVRSRTSASGKPVAIGAGRRAELGFSKLVYHIIYQNWSKLAPEGVPVARVWVREVEHRLPHVAPDIFITYLDGKDSAITHHAMITRNYTTPAHQRHFRLLAMELIYTSSFFSTLWLALPNRPNAERIAADLDNLGGVDNVGIIVIADGAIEEPIVRKPTGGPVPDRIPLVRGHL